MLCFLIAGSYMERKQGTLLFFVFMITLSFFTAFASCTNDSLDWRGFSCANYGLYSYILIDYLFVLLLSHIFMDTIYLCGKQQEQKNACRSCK